MLAQLTISNFAIVRELEIDFHSGMTAITGETGAGKSIAIDALGLCLGGRAGDMVRTGAARADLCARFSLKTHLPPCAGWKQTSSKTDVSVYFAASSAAMAAPAVLSMVQRFPSPSFASWASCSSRSMVSMRTSS